MYHIIDGKLVEHHEAQLVRAWDLTNCPVRHHVHRVEVWQVGRRYFVKSTAHGTSAQFFAVKDQALAAGASLADVLNRSPEEVRAASAGHDDEGGAV